MKFDFFSSVDRKTPELFGVVIEPFELSVHLNGQFPGGDQNQNVGFLAKPPDKFFLFPQLLEHWKSESQGFPGARSVPPDHVFSIINKVESFTLNWEEILEAFLL